jgi:hypothetical protein
MPDYNQQFKEAIKELQLPDKPIERVSNTVKELLNRNSYYIDIHTHLFDIKCVNKAYFLLRAIKDLLGLKAVENISANFDSVDEIYNTIEQSGQGDWAEQLDIEFTQHNPVAYDVTTKGIADWWNARKFLTFKKMEDVYQYYLDEFSLTRYLEKNDVLITALMMDLEMGWGCSLNKDLHTQIDELRILAMNKPVLPFLCCDPRRADIADPDKNLYTLFAKAFSNDGGQPFFGVKIYPAMGYDPSDYRLTPIYEFCQEYNIPVLSHNGGEAVSTDKLKIIVYDADGNPHNITATKRTEMAYQLNDPSRWAGALKKFPKLKLDIAHFGGSATWQQPGEINYKGQKRKETIFNFMKDYENVYADFAFQIVDENASRSLREVLSQKEAYRNKTLFGTDYWVVNPQGNLYNEQTRFLQTLDHNLNKLPLSKILTETNPYKYLFE